VHIPADRESVQLVSIPRDTWLPIDGYPNDSKHAKINAAFAYGGPSLSLRTVEQLTGIAIDHVAIIDWVGFKDLTTALGGIRVYIPETFYDTSQKITWEKGWHEYEGQEALAYVRTRYGLDDGDFDRIKRQQNFMRATMSKLLSGSTTKNPFRLTKVVGVVTGYLTVDKTWDTDEIRSLALDMRNLKTEDVDFVTAPFGRYDTSADGQSIIRLAPKKSQDLWAALQDDDIDEYLDKYPGEKLGDKTSVD
ncbi:MAG: LCP family protein, partial [Actinomycetota bacterium]|nr:LCP family protein [Actinomycetota bacterium]